MYCGIPWLSVLDVGSLFIFSEPFQTNSWAFQAILESLGEGTACRSGGHNCLTAREGGGKRARTRSGSGALHRCCGLYRASSGWQVRSCLKRVHVLCGHKGTLQARQQRSPCPVLRSCIEGSSVLHFGCFLSPLSCLCFPGQSATGLNGNHPLLLGLLVSSGQDSADCSAGG